MKLDLKQFLKTQCIIAVTVALLPFVAVTQDIKQFKGFEKYVDTGTHTYAQTHPYYLINRLKNLPGHVKIIRQLNDSIGIIAIENISDYKLLSNSALVASDTWKLSPEINLKNSRSSPYTLTATQIDSLLPVIVARKRDVVLIQINRSSHSVVIKCANKILAQLIKLPQVIFVDEYKSPSTEINIIGYDRSFSGINVVDYKLPGANGKNIVVGVKEQKMEVTDLDVFKRILPSSIADNKTDNHATVISSIIGGAGNSFYDGRGIANACQFYSSTFSNLFADEVSLLNQNKVTVQNHSYGTVIQQFYGAEAVSYDVQSFTNKNLLHVFSAGNRGLQAATDGKYANLNGFANLTGNFKMAKNIITVAAINNAGVVANESSAGPIYDGRLAPQLTALGPNGTSDAAAIVSGTAAVIQQVYADSNSGVLPPACLVKAIMYNTATDIYTRGIDYKTGFGLLNSFESVKAIQQKKYDGATITQGQQWIKNITVPANAASFKVTLCYTDSAATPNNFKALINDLDIEVVYTNTGTTYKPWVLNSAANTDSLKQIATRKRDSLNTCEQVSIELPQAGNYQIKVTGTTVINTMPFNIAYNIDTLNTFQFTNPQHANDVNREEISNLTIKWKTFVTDTNTTGSLSISYNNGATWQLIQQSVKLYTNQVAWLIKDTNSTAILKMETGFGSFLSPSFILSSVNRPQVDYLCADSFRLSWKKHVYATGYKIFTLIDSAYLKAISIVTDTFIVFRKTLNPTIVYAVEPILGNSLPAIRSIAFDINLQGVACFYKTFYYNLQDGNKLNLLLQLSLPQVTDSIYFEKVTASGRLIQTLGGVKTNAVNDLYNFNTEALEVGLTYLRAKIKLKNGLFVYTDIINVLTSGNKNILFYPNPINKTTPLQYILKQGVLLDGELHFFDASGRLLQRYAKLPNSLNVKIFASGVVFYKLLNKNNMVIETGKLIIN
jgi:hypothetical protein